MTIKIKLRGFRNTVIILLAFSFPCLAQQTWKQDSDFSGAGRESAVSFVIEGQIFITTGNNGSTRYRDLWQYNPETKTWTQRANMATVRSAATGFALDGKGYVTTGWNGSTRFKDTWQYDPGSNTWTQMADFPGEGRTLAVSFVIDGLAYVGLGATGGSTRLGDFWAYSANTNTWKQVADFRGSPRSGAFSFAIDAKGYVGMGNSGASFLNDFWSYDPNTNLWQELNRIPATSRGSAAASANTTIGFMGLGSNGVTRFSDIWLYTPENDRWIRQANFPSSGRDGAVVAMWNEVLYVGLGNDGLLRGKDFWEFSADCPVFAIEADSLPPAIQNTGYSHQLNVQSSVSEPFWEIVSGELPQGLSLDPINGIISGSTQQIGSYQIELKASTKENIIFPDFSIQASSANYPFAEPPQNAIDGDFSTKYLNFDKTNTSLTINTGKRHIARALELTVGNDEPDRDPLSVAVLGSNDGQNFTTVDTLTFYCQSTRLVSTRLPIKNPAAYRFWRIEFLSVCNTNRANSIQVAEIQLKDLTCETRKTLKLEVLSGGNWTKRLDLGVPLQGAVAFSIEGKSYLCTGKTDVAQKSVWCYDGKVWTQKADFPGAARFDAVGFANQGFGYLATGTDGTQKFKDFWQYDPSKDAWTQMADFGGSARSEAVAFVVENDFFVGLGDDNSLLSDFWRYRAGSWQQVSDFAGSARRLATAWAIGNQAFVALGETASGLSREVWKFQDGTWTQEPDFEGDARKAPVSFTFNNYAFVGLGENESDTLSDFWLYDAQQKAWLLKTRFPGPKRSRAVGFALGDKGFIATGSLQKDLWQYDLNCPLGKVIAQAKAFALNQNWPFQTTFEQEGAVGDVNWLAYNLPSGLSLDAQTGILSGSIKESGQLQSLIVAKNEDCEQTEALTFSVSSIGAWRKGKDFLGAARVSASAFALDGKGYIFGGLDSLNITRRDFWQYNPTNGAWLQKADMPLGRRNGIASFAMAGKAYLGMGQAGSSIKNDFWQYDPQTDGWKQISPAPIAIRNAVSFVINNKAYLGLGYGNDYQISSSFYSYDPQTDVWSSVAGFPKDDFYSSYGSFATKQYGYVLADGYFYRYDPTTDSWQEKAYPPQMTDTYFEKLVQIENTGLLTYLGGSCMYYDETTDTWLRKAKNIEAVSESSFFNINDTLYKVCGSQNGVSRNVAQYNTRSDCEVEIATANLPNGIAGQSYRATVLKLNINSLPDIIWEATGLPEGLFLNSQTGALSGTPTQTGTFEVGIKAFYQECSGGQKYTIQIRDAPIGLWVERAGLSPDLARRLGIGFAANEQFFVGLGNDGALKQDLWAYNPQTNTWQKRKDFPGKARESAMAFVLDGVAYVGGGKSGSEVLSDFWSYRPSTDTWSQVASLPAAVEGGIGFAVLGQGIVGLGSAGKSLWSYSPPTNTWTALRNFPGLSRKGASVFVIGDNGYVGLGDEGWRFLNDLWQYNPLQDRWTRMMDFPSSPRALACSFSLGEYGWFGGGFNGNFLKDFWQYDPYNNQWLEVAEFTGTARSGAVAAALGSFAYLATGNDGRRKADLWQYRPAACNNVTIMPERLPDAIKGVSYAVQLKQNTLPASLANWEIQGLPEGFYFDSYTQKIAGTALVSGSFNVLIKARLGTCEGKREYTLRVNEGNSFLKTPTALPDGLRSAAVFVLADTAYIVGGQKESGELNATVWKYNLRTQTVVGSNDFVEAERIGAVGFAIGEKGFIALGQSYGNYRKDFWQYNPKTGKWTQLPDFAGRERAFATVFVIDSLAYIGSGQNLESYFLGDFWSFNPKNNQFLSLAPLPSPRKAAVSWALSSKGYVLGGYSEEFFGFDNPKIWVYLPTSNQWISKPSPALSLRREEATGFVLQNKGYLSQGLVFEDFAFYPDNSLWQFDPVSEQWLKILEGQIAGIEPRLGAISFANDEYAFIGMGEFNQNYYSDLWKFSPDCPSNTKISPVALPDRVASQPYFAQLDAAGLEGNITWQLNPLLPLPEGLELDYQTGIISGTPTQSGPINILATATNGFCSASQLFFPNLTIWNGTTWMPAPPDNSKTAAIIAPYNTDLHGDFTAQNCVNLSKIKVAPFTQITIKENLNNLGSICSQGNIQARSLLGNPIASTASPLSPRAISVEGYNNRDSTATLNISWTAAQNENYKLVVLKAGAPINPKMIIDGNIYAANPDWQGFSDQIDGGKVVYQGKEDFVQVRNLTGRYENYFASVFEYNMQESCGAVYSKPETAQIIAALPKSSSLTKVVAYPNPAQNTLTIQTHLPAKGRLLTLAGVQLADFECENQKELDVSGLPRGMYLVELTHKAGREVIKITLQ